MNANTCTNSLELQQVCFGTELHGERMILPASSSGCGKGSTLDTPTSMVNKVNFNEACSKTPQ
eukprot:5222749-Pleurochrysis_carterae.AAC.6